MQSEIFYFSGTGNTLYIAEYLSKKIGAIITSIEKVYDKKIISSDANIIGIILPVYYGDAPNIVKKFVENLVNIENKYIFLIANYGGGKGISIRSLKKIIDKKGGKVNAQIGIHMPQNSFYKKYENKEVLHYKCNKKLDKIAPYINNQKYFSDVGIFDIIQIPMQFIIHKMTREFFLEFLNESPEKTTEDLTYLADRSYTVTNNCTGCKICSQICPVKNIQIINDRPKWLNRCENCKRCYNICPQKAIKIGLMKKDFYYKNPKIEISELISYFTQ